MEYAHKNLKIAPKSSILSMQLRFAYSRYQGNTLLGLNLLNDFRNELGAYVTVTLYDNVDNLQDHFVFRYNGATWIETLCQFLSQASSSSFTLYDFEEEFGVYQPTTFDLLRFLRNVSSHIGEYVSSFVSSNRAFLASYFETDHSFYEMIGGAIPILWSAWSSSFQKSYATSHGYLDMSEPANITMSWYL